MSRSGFMIYGAYGYTGELIARRAVARGHRPLLAGRQRGPLEALARELGLPSVAVALQDSAALVSALERVEVVCHAAGPFVHTSERMVDACLTAQTSYVDITGELPVFARIFSLDEPARRRGVALLPGVGFDVVPSDCLARFVADAVPGATELDIAFATLGRPSGGTTKSSFQGLLRGTFVRREGELREITLGEGVIDVQFSDRKRSALPIPWGDLETAFRTTRIPNITTYMGVPSTTARLLSRALPYTSRFLPPVLRALSRPKVRGAVLSVIDAFVSDPDAREREAGGCFLWARARAADHRTCEAWLDTADGYAFTAQSAVLALEHVMQERPRGALTPAGAFGADFVLEVEGSVRYERLPAP